MADALTFYTNPQTRGRIVRWMLEEVGTSYDTRVMSLFDPAQMAELRAINPMGKLPTIVHGDVVVTETPAICAYLADAFPAAGLAPPIDRRGAYYRWLFFAAAPLEQAMTDRRLGVEPEGRMQLLVGYGSFDRTIDALEQAVSTDGWLAADHFTAADLYVGAQIGFALQFGMIPKRDAFVAFSERVQARPAARRAVAIDGELPPPAAAAVG